MAKTTRKNLLQTTEELRWDLWLAATAIGLALFGVIMVYSASAGTRNPNAFLYGQIRWAALGLIMMLVLRRVDYHRFAQPGFVYGFLGVCVILLLLVFLFPKVNNAHRWIRFKDFSAQPSELAKIALVIFLAWFLSERERDGDLDNFWATIAPAGVVVGLLSVLILKEPDLGTTLMLGVIFLTMLFVAGCRRSHLYKLSPILASALVYLVVNVVWRWERVMTFIDPESDPQGKGYQTLQSLIAVGSGGMHGLGFGQGRQKLAFLPEPQSDFIFSVVSEELGLSGAMTLTLVFGFFLWRGLRAGFRAPDRLGMLLAVGLTTSVVIQAFFNISVALNLVPAKGITLPFISAGGSSLITAFAAVGILLNVSEQGIETGRVGGVETGRRGDRERGRR
ncbi:MAG TPA: putative peptidoglycan glycosyltransferase FtsW [Blastocatellia bacterium]|nr:putative peptidoglycan glycosyltransferase FtsW [Blastocatellia bacterium]